MKSAYDLSPCCPLVSDASKDRIAKKMERAIRNSRFMRAQLEYEYRELPPLAKEPEYRR